MKNKFLSVIFFLIFFNVWCFAAEQPVIAVIKSMDIAPYNDALEGFNETLKKRKVSFELKEFDLKEEDVIKKIKSIKPDLILTIGPYSTRIVSKEIKNIPIIFSVILDIDQNYLKAKNITGASVRMPPKIQFENLKTIIPKVKRIGVIYNPKENEHIISKAKIVARGMGIILKTYPVKSTKEVPNVEEMGIDALWLIPDTIVCYRAIIKYILLSSLKHKIPVMGISPSYARAGALLALSCDYEDIGRQSGEISIRILNEESPADIPISAPRKTKLYLNQLVADRLGIKIPRKIIGAAAEVFGK